MSEQKTVRVTKPKADPVTKPKRGGSPCPACRSYSCWMGTAGGILPCSIANGGMR